MIKKFSILLTIIALTFSLVGCKSGNDKTEDIDKNNVQTEIDETNEDNEIDETNNEIDTEKDTEEDTNDSDEIQAGKMIDISTKEVDRNYLLYLYKSYENISDFYAYFSKIGEAIDSKDEILTSYYFDLIEDIKKDTDELVVPDKFKDAHSYLVSAIDNYYKGLSILKTSFDKVDYEEYKKADKLMNNASEEIDTYVSYIDGSLDEFLNYVDVLSETDYYFKLITIYEYDKTFSEEENNALFILERSLSNFVENREKLLPNILSSNEKEIKTNIDNMNNSIKEIEAITIENEHISSYKQDTLNSLYKYLDYCVEFNRIISDNSFSYNYFDINDELQEFAYQVYDNLQSISDFYKTYDIDLGYTTSDSQLETE